MLRSLIIRHLHQRPQGSCCPSQHRLASGDGIRLGAAVLVWGCPAARGLLQSRQDSGPGGSWACTAAGRYLSHFQAAAQPGTLQAPMYLKREFRILTTTRPRSARDTGRGQWFSRVELTCAAEQHTQHQLVQAVSWPKAACVPDVQCNTPRHAHSTVFVRYEHGSHACHQQSGRTCIWLVHAV